MTKNSQIILFAVIVVLLGGFIFYYSLKEKPSVSPPNPELNPEQKAEKLQEISESLTIQEDTPKFRTKLLEMSKSLNK